MQHHGWGGRILLRLWCSHGQPGAPSKPKSPLLMRRSARRWAGGIYTRPRRPGGCRSRGSPRWTRAWTHRPLWPSGRAVADGIPPAPPSIAAIHLPAAQRAQKSVRAQRARGWHTVPSEGPAAHHAPITTHGGQENAAWGVPHGLDGCGVPLWPKNRPRWPGCRQGSPFSL